MERRAERHRRRGVLRRFGGDGFLFGAGQFGAELFGNGAGDFALDGKDIIELAVVTSRPRHARQWRRGSSAHSRARRWRFSARCLR